MQYSLNWNSNDNLFFAAIITVAFGFMSYHFISKSKNLENKLTTKFGKQKAMSYVVYFHRFLGFLFFGILPFLVLSIFSSKNIEFYGVNFNNLSNSLYWLLGFSVPLISMNYFNSKKQDNLELYPQIRTPKWNVNILVISSLTWGVYLFAYEFMFRGFLLFVSLQYMGTWSAIALNMAIYALVHVPKGIKEAVGALPLGIVLCIITIQTQSMLFAFLIHLVLALSNEWLSLKAHPNISFNVKI